MDKVDFKKVHKLLYSPYTKTINLVEVPQLNFLVFEGQGNPDSNEDYRKASDTIIRLSYSIKFLNKSINYGPDYINMPLEGIWWTEGSEDYDYQDKESMRWILYVMQPYFISEEHVKAGKERTASKKGIFPEYLDKIAFETTEEGLSAQLVHVGPYEERGGSIDKLRAYQEVNGLENNGKYHEIYIGDPRRARPENLKTILRQPVRSKAVAQGVGIL